MKRSTKQLTTKQVKRQIRKHSRKWIPVLGLQSWDIKVFYLDAQISSDHEGLDVIMDTTSAWETLQATIVVYLPVAKYTKKNELVMSLMHELVHILMLQL